MRNGAGGTATTTRYYYDGQNVIAEYTWNGSTETPARQYVNGTRSIDERVVLRDVAGGGVDHYYLLEELYSVAGLAASNGMLEEAVVYETYGQAGVTQWPFGDVDRDGDVDEADVDTITAALNQTEPLCDINLSGGAVTSADVIAASLQKNQGKTPDLRTGSSVGNPYLFTGRPSDTLCATSGLVSEDASFRRIQDNRNRTYDPTHGRWLQRDPLGVRPDGPTGKMDHTERFREGLNPYQYVKSNPAGSSDPSGMWGAQHQQWTFDIGSGIVGQPCAGKLAAYDMGTDEGGTGPAPWGDYRYHFDVDPTWGLPQTGARDEARRIETNRIRQGIANRNCCAILMGIGRLLHIDQDTFSHQAHGAASDGSGPHNAGTPAEHLGWIPGAIPLPNPSNPNFWNPHRPDDPDLFPDDAQVAQTSTESLIRSYEDILKSPPCCCSPRSCCCSFCRP